MGKKLIALMCFMLLTSGFIFAQETVSGQVSDDGGAPLPGVNVVVKGTSTGTSTDADGNYTITVPDNQSVLVYSFLGFVTQEELVGNQSTINVSLQEDTEALEEVVVTALGIKREQKKLGYSVQKVSPKELEVAQAPSIGSKLSGKVAGLQVNTSSRIGGSSRFVIRGESSLSLGGNEALIVVDGVPINGTSSTDERIDFGGGVLDFNSNNIASISVLKGGAAAALYGSRAGNGVVLITTKSGEGQKPFTVEYTNSLMLETLLSYPDTYQYKYAPGRGIEGTTLFTGRGEYNPATRYDTWGTGEYDPSQYIEWFYSPTSNGFRAGDVNIDNKGIVTRYPFQSTGKNNFKEFFRTGRNFFNTLSVSTNSKNTAARFSFENMQQEGMQPGTDLKRNTFSTNITTKLGDKFKLNFVMNYANVKSGNRPQSVWNSNDIMNALFSMPPGTRIDQLRDYWQPGLEGQVQFAYRVNGDPNPYFVAHERRTSQNRHRFFGNLNLTYNFTDDLYLTLRHGDDMAFENRRWENAAGYARSNAFDELRINDIQTRESNTDFLLGWNKQINQDFNLNVSAGGNLRNTESKTYDSRYGQLLVKGLFSLANLRNTPTPTERRLNSRVYSLYVFADISYKDWAFLSLTRRSDWSSTLPAANNRFSYPSASLSIIASELFQMPRALSFVKIRGAVAEVGKDAPIQSLFNTLGSDGNFNGLSGYAVPAGLRNPTLKPQEEFSWEVGLETRLFTGRIGLEATYYKSNTINQVIGINLPESSGFTSRQINAGDIENKGVEIKLDGKVIQLGNFKWNTTAVFTANENKVIKLGDEGLDQLQLAEFPNGYGAIISKVGFPLMGVFGYKQQTVDDTGSPFFGQKVHAEDGSPLRREDLEYLGDANPDYLIGITNEFSYKNISFSFLFDIRQGGKLFSTNTDWMFSNGFNTISQQWRDQGGVNGGGVIRQADETYRKNDVTVEPLLLKQVYVNKYRAVTENNTYDASYVKLREVNLTYNLPKRLMSNLPIEKVSLSLMGRDLFIWDDVPNQDPDILQRGIPGYSGIYGVVSGRSFGASLNITL